MLYHEKLNFMPITISATFMSLCGNCAVFAFLFIISVQTNNPGDLANRLSLIARLLKTLHCNTIAIPREELPMGVNVILLLDSFYNVKVTNGSYRKVWRVWLNLYRYILFECFRYFRIIHVRKDIRTFLLVNWGAICLIMYKTHI